MRPVYSSLFLMIFLVIACSAPEQTTKPDQNKEAKIYPSEEIKRVDTVKTEIVTPVQPNEEKPKNTPKFIVQVGAFTSKERAETFMRDNQGKIAQKMGVSFNDKVQLYVVRLPELDTRDEAEKLRNDLWKIPEFKDAFIITTEE